MTATTSRTKKYRSPVDKVIKKIKKNKTSFPNLQDKRIAHLIANKILMRGATPHPKMRMEDVREINDKSYHNIQLDEKVLDHIYNTVLSTKVDSPKDIDFAPIENEVSSEYESEEEFTTLQSENGDDAVNESDIYDDEQYDLIRDHDSDHEAYDLDSLSNEYDQSDDYSGNFSESELDEGDEAEDEDDLFEISD